MKSLNHPADRAEIIRRLKNIAPDAKGQFGTLTAPRMITQGQGRHRPLIARDAPTEFANDVERLCALVERFAKLETKVGATHPFFGSMTRPSWGILAYRHFDHHFRQFGGSYDL